MTENEIAHTLAWRYYVEGHDHDDLAQEVRYAIERARPGFDPRKGSWTHFAWLVAERHLKELVTAANRQKRGKFVELSLEVQAPQDLVSLVEDRENLRKMLEAPLTERERVALGQLIRGEPITSKSMDNARYKAKRKVALALLKEAA